MPRSIEMMSAKMAASNGSVDDGGRSLQRCVRLSPISIRYAVRRDVRISARPHNPGRAASPGDVRRGPGCRACSSVPDTVDQYRFDVRPDRRQLLFDSGEGRGDQRRLLLIRRTLPGERLDVGPQCRCGALSWALRRVAKARASAPASSADSPPRPGRPRCPHPAPSTA